MKNCGVSDHVGASGSNLQPSRASDHPLRTTEESSFPSTLRAWSLVGILIVAYVLCYLDRQILSLLVEPIKRDLSINDTQISLLQGFVFAIFLAFAGIPIGRRIDTGRRMTILAAGIAFWSAMTVCCGLAGTFWMLLIFRLGVGVGEATLMPAAYSIIGDSFPPRRLGLAFAIYGIGSYIGIGLAYVIGASILSSLSSARDIGIAHLGSFHPWQLAFIIAGLPGLLVALGIAHLSEPIRQGGAQQHKTTRSEVARYFKDNLRSIAPLYAAIASASIMTFSAIAWVPSFFIRRFGWTAVQVGHNFGLLIILSGVIGLFAGGLAGDLAIRSGMRNGRLTIMLIFSLAAAPFAIAAPLVGTPWLSLLLFSAALFLTTGATLAGTTAKQEMMPNRMRGVATSLSALVVYIIGLGAGPTMVALMTDYVLRDESKIGYALACIPPIMLLASALLTLSCLQPYLRSLDYRDRWQSGTERVVR